MIFLLSIFQKSEIFQNLVHTLFKRIIIPVFNEVIKNQELAIAQRNHISKQELSVFFLGTDTCSFGLFSESKIPHHNSNFYNSDLLTYFMLNFGKWVSQRGLLTG